MAQQLEWLKGSAAQRDSTDYFAGYGKVSVKIAVNKYHKNKGVSIGHLFYNIPDYSFLLTLLLIAHSIRLTPHPSLFTPHHSLLTTRHSLLINHHK